MGKICLYTYNVGNYRPPDDYSSFRIFKEAKQKTSNIYVVALQEIPHMEITKMESVSRTWRGFFGEMMAACDLTLVYSIPLVSNLFLVFSDVKFASFVQRKETRCARYTMGGTLGYKGTMGIRLHLRNGVHLIFVISHLIHGDKNIEYRCQQVKQAASCMFDDVCKSEKRILFWLGDLNFRVDNDSTNRCIIPSNVPSDLHVTVDEQLKTLMNQGRIFEGFYEPEITFPPTYRFIVRQDIYDHARRPSWCDRILVRSTNMVFKNLEYCSDASVRYSDHRPVLAIYEVTNLLDESDSNPMLCCFQEIPTWHSSVYFMAKFSFIGNYYNQNGSNFDWIGFFKFPIKSMEEMEYWIYMATAYKMDAFDPQHGHSDTYIAECPALSPGDYVVAYYSTKFQSFIGINPQFSSEDGRIHVRPWSDQRRSRASIASMQNRRWIDFSVILSLLFLPHITNGIRCYCTDDHCSPYGVCESSVCLIGALKSNNAVIRTCGDEPVGCQREIGKWADLCACDQPLCNTFSYFRSSTRKERGHSFSDHDFAAPPLSHDDIDDDPPVIFQRVDPPLGEFSGYDRPPANTFPMQSNTNTLVFVLVPFSVGCVIVIIVWINYYRNLC